MRAFDLVVSVDSFPAHLAGALGVPTWTLLRTPSDRRWGGGRDGAVVSDHAAVPPGARRHWESVIFPLTVALIARALDRPDSR